MIRANEDKTSIFITRQDGNPCAVISLEKHNSLQEAAHLMSHPANLKKLMNTIEELIADIG